MAKQVKTHWETHKHFQDVQRWSYKTKNSAKTGIDQRCQNSKELFNDKQKQEKNTIFLLKRRGKSVTKDAEKGEVLNISFSSVCASTARPWEQKSRLK